MDKQAREAREHMKALTPREKWNNFWYYYKIHVLAGIFAVILIVFTAVECANRINYDLNISYYSSTAISDDGISKLTEYFKSAVDDINQNGSVDVGIASCYADPDEQSEQTQAVMVKLSAELAAGDSMGYLLDEKYKEIFMRNYPEAAEKLLDISDIPEIREAIGAADGEKLYWVTKTVYETEQNKPEKLAQHDNAKKVEALLEK